MTVRARWLGQAGFWLTATGPGGAAHLLVDPYLSDSLARKYAGTTFPHVRMLPPPVTTADLPPLCAVLSSHAHTDHMDPDTLVPLMAAQPELRLACPRAVLDQALRRSRAPRSRLDALADGDRVDYGPFTVTALPAAHEERVRDSRGDDHFLGYVVEVAGTRVYHSGDCVPWDGQIERLAALDIDVALLPVNGRDAHRLAHGVPGNFDFAEAVALCAAAGIGTLVPHHWGMFAFNTVDPATFDLDAAARRGVTVRVPRHDGTLDLTVTR
ncbi:MBL fold metallo-hydrolase [Micromonospora sp. NBC_01655]|uniref:MBL fold metallo-hydrolase n=1 Tax=Micromonospora sp. NBC_01655 TaxID=2975983 RepID=UPI00225C0DA1|nr:MBL fold metallo-hydrolase [Micromonospora sp. NBC_01655]MCX4471733.1 MBL fold metallo-hydrolase [Micromonospora sp. NBC_01655]